MTEHEERASALRAWFDQSASVDRATYLHTGLVFAALKFALDWSLMHLVADHSWTLAQYLQRFTPPAAPLDKTTAIALFAASLPFAWIGLSMSIRRGIDAGRSPWFGFLFLVPYLNYAVIALLCALPSRPRVARSPIRHAWNQKRNTVLVTVAAVSAVNVLLGAAILLLSVYVFDGYYSSMFLSTPLAMGALIGFVLNARHDVSLGQTLLAGAATILAAGGMLLLFALEGAICIAMIVPLAAPASMVGAYLGRTMALSWARGVTQAHEFGWLAVALVLGLGSEVRFQRERSYSVATTVEIDAPPSVVWEHVVSFSDLEEPPGSLFRAGLAYPLRARIEGSGVGAVRHCEFSTGAFVEPITVWDEPRRLAFDVVAQPAPMHEWSPYANVHPPHLDGSFRSTAGEFLLEPLEGGRTRLTGTTWYVLELHPAPYWRLWSDGIVHAIHERVLRHVARESEAAAPRTLE